MKVRAPSLKLDMILSDVAVRDGQPVIICRLGVYEATTDISPEDARRFLKCLIRPKVLLAFFRLAIRK